MTVAEMIEELSKLPQDKIVAREYPDGSFGVIGAPYIETLDRDICLDFHRIKYGQQIVVI